MSYRDQLKDDLIFDEGLRYTVYKDTLGYNTIGVGRCIDTNPLPAYAKAELEANGKLSLTTILELLEKDIDKAEQNARKLFESFNDFTDNRKGALVNLLFNLGITTFSKFITCIAAVRNGQWGAAGAALKNSKWYRQVQKTRSERIIRQIIEG